MKILELKVKFEFQGAILDLQFGQEGEHIFTASSDNTVGMFDYATGTRLKRMKGHHGIVNAVHAARRGDPLICSASDDATIKIWDSRRRKMSEYIFFLSKSNPDLPKYRDISK